ncbi:hypothetical protein [Tuwongella immobilis]|uniref:Uncharacterized protein n=1 Tax=Tuwongella immobilis TaxID=692036 RepID=A0A6C2YSB4_9BACT|nr:hypothetical protein [Tuwongella immobilis]VIP03865.1 Uncharacterized protein OS=Cyclobacteriaceae bacterium AK24 GN=ADIS_0320 PE=4 SV=1 [Tuwongella immobilis]VTS05097.1 Uncharacterized protein OS=Cyclobacteriaceae bacterium AK24 GN=ADIS_0320 PE=4 SV=1 [Tuwongella immobilis]
MATKTWNEKLLSAKSPKCETLAKPFAGIPAGARLFIASPKLIQTHIAHIPYGETQAITHMRATFAKAHDADATCPTSTSIFLRIVAEAALEDLAAGAQIDEITPFWRLISPQCPIAKKLSCGPEWIAQQRQLEHDIPRERSLSRE